MRLNNVLEYVICASLVLLLQAKFNLGYAWADAAGDVFAKKVYERDDGKDSYTEAILTLTDKDGDERVRTLVTSVKDFGKLVKTNLLFTEPQMIKGTSFLSVENEDKDDDQFLYLPSIGRVRRVVSSQKSSSFANTDFTYEDLERRKPEKDENKIIGHETISNIKCTILESVPVDQDNSQYGKVVSWISDESLLPIKTDYYDKNGTLVKRFEIQEQKKVNGIWTAMHTTMSDLDSGHKTKTAIKTVRYNQGISDEVFTEKYLEHAN